MVEQLTASKKTYQEQLNKETALIYQRRKRHHPDHPFSTANTVGLALSGGGIRSAVFNLGLLQALENHGLFKWLDYLSTVSGGGYIGAALSAYLCQQTTFPFGSSRKNHADSSRSYIDWIRHHAHYLTPSRYLNGWALGAAVLRGLCVNLSIIIPLLFCFIYFSVATQIPAPSLLNHWPDTLFTWSIFAGLMAWALLWVIFIVYALLSTFRFEHGFIWRTWVSIIQGSLLKIGLIFLLVGSIETVAKFFIVLEWSNMTMMRPHNIIEQFQGFSTEGLISLLTGLIAIFGLLFGQRKTLESNRLSSVVVAVALLLITYGLVVWLYRGAFLLYAGIDPRWDYLIMPGLVLSIILGFFANINHVSMHHYYRDRIVDAFNLHHDSKAKIPSLNLCLLKDMHDGYGPYPIINANLVTLDSDDHHLRSRGGANFIFSPLYCGSDATGYIETEHYLKGKMDLGTAVAISGAAINPNIGITHSRPMSFIMSLLNIRLGYWLRNPALKKTKLFFKLFPLWHPIWHFHILREMLAWKLYENSNFVHLADGGHFENLGLYELIRRRCKLVIVSDASADPKWELEDLANVIRKVRIDFGAEIMIDTYALKPRSARGLAEKPYAIGYIKYVDGSEGYMIYIKTSIVADLPEDILSYQRMNPRFPNQATSNQFFDEAQFEAYRELGFQLTRKALLADEVRRIISALNIDVEKKEIQPK